MKPPVTLLTDFGEEGPYPASMKGVISSLTDAPVLDITHHVPRHDVGHGAFLLWAAAPYFPESTVHCCVVDPGVGTERGAVAVDAGGQYLVGPDNGLMEPAAKRLSGGGAYGVREIDLDFDLPPSKTFDGRDLFAPTAAELSSDLSFEQVGPETDLEPLELFVYEETGRGFETEVAFVDDFGNCVTGAPGDAAEPDERFEVETPHGVFQIRCVETYGDGDESEPLLLEGSTGLLELSVNRGSGAELLGLDPGDRVEIRKEG